MTDYEALVTLAAAKALVGRRWRSIVWAAWQDGGYGRRGLGAIAGRLQQARNSLGPSWLAGARLPKEG